tara:strand:- start:1098 stop:5231 length:4134 start_codon:yes stop_codon:yes gene_type:complete
MVTYSDSDFEETETSSPPEGGAGRIYSDSDFEETETPSPPEGGADRTYSDSDFEEKKDVELTMDDLNTNKVWVGAANKIYEHEAGKKFEAGDQGYDNIADWFKKRHANLGNDITNMAMTVADAETDAFGEMSDEVKGAWVDSLNIWDKTEADMGSFWRGLGSAVTDPTTWLGLVAGFGVGGIAKLAGHQVAKKAGVEIFKKALQKNLIQKNYSKEAVKEAIEHGATDLVSKEAIQEASEQAAKAVARNRYKKLIGTGAAWGVAESLPRQQFQESIGRGEGITFGETAVDVLAAAGVVGALPIVGKGLKKGYEKLRGRGDVVKEVTEEAAEEVIDTAQKGSGVTKAGKRPVDEADDVLPSGEPVKDSPNQKVVEVSADEIVEGAPVQRSRIVETLAKINTKAGRLLSSHAALPKTLMLAAIRRERHDKAMVLEIKKSLTDITIAAKKEKVPDEVINKFINGEKADLRLVGTETLEALQAAQKKIAGNETKLNKLLGFPEDSAGLGVNRKGDEFYLTRTFEASHNTSYLKRIKKALKGEEVDARFLTKVEHARAFFRGHKATKDMTPSQIDGMIEHLVANLAKPKEAEFILSLGQQFDTLVGQGKVGASAAHILKTRKEIKAPILKLLGESESGVQKISETLTKQSQLMAHLQYVAQVDDFAKAALRQSGDVATVKLGGFISFLPRQQAKIVKGKLELDAGKNLFELTEKAAGTFAKSSTLLKDIYTSPQFASYIDNGINYWTQTSGAGKLFGNIFAKPAGLGQATQTILDVPAYAINTYGAFQSLVSNGYVLNFGAGKAAIKNLREMVRRVQDKDPEAIRRLTRLKADGVIDSDLSSEMIIKNINLFGKDPINPFSRAYQGSLNFLSRAYSSPDTYAKLIAHEVEFNNLKKMFPKRNVDELFDMASERVRDVIPSYSVASPAARQLSQAPIGTYALFPAEVVRTTKNTLKVALRDIKEGAMKDVDGQRNTRQVVHGLKRLTGLGTTLTGVGMYIQNNNEQLGVTNDQVRLIDVLSHGWGKGSNRLHLTGMEEGPDGKIYTRFINSTTFDAQDYLKVPIRLLTGRVLAGEDVSDFEVEEGLKAMQQAAIGPYTNPKFLTEALLNVFANKHPTRDASLYQDYQGGFLGLMENLKRGVLEVASAFEPGTSQAVRTYLNSMSAEEVQDLATSASGWPLREADIFNWLFTGIRTTTMDVDKSLGYTMSKQIKNIEATKKEFMNYMKGIKPQEFTPGMAQEIIAKYRELQGIKRENFTKLAQTISLASDMQYYTPNRKGKEESRKYGYGRVLRAATDGFFYKENPELIRGIAASTMDQASIGAFQPDDVANSDVFIKLLQQKFKSLIPSKIDIMSMLNKAFSEEMLVPTSGKAPKSVPGLSYRP